MRHAEEVSVWKETPAENVNSLINNVKIAKVDSVKLFIKKKLTASLLEEHVRSLQTVFNASIGRKITLTDAIAKIRDLLESGCLIDHSHYFMKIAKMKREVQRLTGSVESKILELQSMRGLI